MRYDKELTGNKLNEFSKKKKFSQAEFAFWTLRGSVRIAFVQSLFSVILRLHAVLASIVIVAFAISRRLIILKVWGCPR